MIEFLKPFVPVDYQLNEKTFYHYLKTLAQKEYSSYMLSLTTYEKGLSLIVYHPKTTVVNYYKWTDVKDIIDIYFNKRDVILKQLEIQF